MKKGILAIVAGLLLVCSANAHAFQFNNWFYSESGCTTYTIQTPPPAAGKAFCLDSTSQAFYVWNGSAFVAANAVGGIFSSPTINEQTIAGGIQASSSGYNAFIISSPVCTTTGAGGTCAEPTHTFSPVGFADANYFINCTVTGVGAAVPEVQSVSKASNAVVVTIAGLTSVSASASTIDCVAIHN